MAPAAPGVLSLVLPGVPVPPAAVLPVVLPVDPVEPAVPLEVPAVLPELVAPVPAPAVSAPFFSHAPSVNVATSAASNTEYFMLVPLKKI